MRNGPATGAARCQEQKVRLFQGVRVMHPDAHTATDVFQEVEFGIESSKKHAIGH